MTLLDQYNILLEKATPTDTWPGKTVTDKGTYHCFIQEYYNKKFTPLKNTPICLLELGVEYGYSIDLWRSWFTDLTLVGIDPYQPDTIKRINSFPQSKGIEADGYIEETVNMFSDNTFDFIIEDGPHTLQTQIFAAKHWVNKLKPGGFLIIEDVQHPDTDVKAIVEEIKHIKNIQVLLYNFGLKTGRRDDVIIEIQKR